MSWLNLLLEGFWYCFNHAHQFTWWDVKVAVWCNRPYIFRELCDHRNRLHYTFD